jgi:CubicO group peptidase (beta-lactamase class C family)
MITRMGRVVLLACGLAGSARGQAVPHARPEEVGLRPAQLERITRWLHAEVDSGKLPGVVAVVARHGKVGYVGSVGAMNTGAVFRIYSLTKPIASAAVMQLVENGKIRLDDPVSKYIPAFAQVKVFAGGSADHPMLRDPNRPVTISDLLTHTSGLTYGFFGQTSVDTIYRRAGLYQASWTLAQLADSLAHLPLAFDPGTHWSYSFAIDVLGRVVEVASGTTFDRYLDSALFQPLGMQTTAFHATPAMQGRILPAYTRGPDGKLHEQTPLLSPEFTADGKLLSGGGGLLSTPDDYLRFAQMLLNRGQLNGVRVLKPETVALMMQNHVADSLVPIQIAPGWPPGSSGFGYGGAVRMDSGGAAGTMPGNAGTFRWAGAATTFYWVDPKADLIAMLWTQYVPVTEMWALDVAYQRLVYGAVVKP